ncbi:MAG: diphosphate--fructose-6-phosphate 1-phosphotransferase [Treponema sp.]|jgi:pyrophosphate--fructose-6-phosphate 1-phosphotransferase|nr:diphosphate--fructose-6-phosphate 1-phosphotransferase [Treponema sp.]
MEVSALQKARYGYKPKLPAALAGDIKDIAVTLGAAGEAASDQAALREIFARSYGKPLAAIGPGNNAAAGKALRVGVVLSGGQAPGGHNVIAGLYDGLKKGNPASELVGFLGGPAGLIENKTLPLSGDVIDAYRNTGGFDIIGSGRTKIETPEQFAASLATARALRLDAIVIIGGDDSNTNAALLAEYFLREAGASGKAIQVIGCPKTIDGDLKNAHIEASFGFDTACKTYSELIGNIERDANSARKYWHFIKLMGRSASHIALECALQTQPNVCLISEEVSAKGLSLADLAAQISDSVVKRAARGDHFGVALIPEGLVEFVPEMKALIAELNDIAASHGAELEALSTFTEQMGYLKGKLSPSSFKVIETLPEEIARQLLMERDPHGNVQVSLIETEKLLVGLVKKTLAALKAEGVYKGKFSALGHFFGYEGRCAFPSNFDADYCYSLGYTAFVLIAAGLTGYLSSVRNLAAPAAQWQAGGIPLTMMMHIEQRRGEKKPVIKKALVELEGGPFKAFAAQRDQWAVETCYRFPGAIQYYGPAEVCDQPSLTLMYEAKH